MVAAPVSILTEDSDRSNLGVPRRREKLPGVSQSSLRIPIVLTESAVLNNQPPHTPSQSSLRIPIVLTGSTRPTGTLAVMSQSSLRIPIVLTVH